MYRDEHVVIGPANHAYAWVVLVREQSTAMVLRSPSLFRSAVHGMGDLRGVVLGTGEERVGPIGRNVACLAYSTCTFVQGGLTVTKWLQDWFNQPSVVSGDPTRSSIEDVHRMCGGSVDELRSEAVKAGWHVVCMNTHYVLIPNGTISVVC